MSVQAVTPILNVTDVTESIKWFESLGWTQSFIWLDDGKKVGFGGVISGEQAQIFLCLNGQGSRGTIMPRHAGDDETDGVWMSWWVSSVEELNVLHEKALNFGYTVTMAPQDKPWDVREFHLRHPDGHMFRVSCGLSKDEDIA